MLKEEDDPVMKEIPVYISKGLNGQLHLLQFQQKPITIPFQEDSAVLQAHIKPGQNKLKLTLDMETEVRYSKSKGEAFYSRAKGKAMSHNDTKERHELLREQILESRSIPTKSQSQRYVAGVIKDGQLHLTPLKSILQMQNKPWYLDSADRIDAQSKKNSMDEDSENESDNEPTKVTLKFKQNRGTDQTKSKLAPKTYKAIKTKEEEEPWIKLDYFAGQDGNLDYEKLYTFKNDEKCDTPLSLVERSNYLPMLFPKQRETEVEGTTSLFTSNKSSVSHS